MSSKNSSSFFYAFLPVFSRAWLYYSRFNLLSQFSPAASSLWAFLFRCGIIVPLELKTPIRGKIWAYARGSFARDSSVRYCFNQRYNVRRLLPIDFATVATGVPCAI